MLEIFLIFLCLFINSLFSATEAAFIALNKPYLKSLAKKGEATAQSLLHLRENPEKVLSVIQIGITFVASFAAAIGGIGGGEYISPWIAENLGAGETTAELLATLTIVIPLTYLSVVFGELIPKTWALKRSFWVTSTAYPWIRIITKILYPIVILFEYSTKKALKILEKKEFISEEKEVATPSISEDISPLNHRYIMNMVKIENTTAKEVYLEWDNVITVDIKQPKEEIQNTLLSSRHTRVPVLDGSVVSGVINSKEFFALQSTEEDWRVLIRKAVIIEEKMPILYALRILQQNRTHMGIVYRGSEKIGIITMETIFEEVIGDIYDEDDDGTIEKIIKAHLRHPILP